MKVAVVGAGIVGITTAHVLCDYGHEVTVFERAAAAAENASFANTGMMSPSLSNLLAHPDWPQDSWLHRFGSIDNLTTSLRSNIQHRNWRNRWKHPSNPERYIANLRAAQALIGIGQERFQKLQSEATLEHELTEGVLLLANSEDSLAKIQPKLEFLRTEEVKFEVLTGQELQKREPSLSSKIEHHGGVYFQGDSVHNCRQFALQLKNHLLKMGVIFQFNHEVTGITAAPQPSLRFRNHTDIAFDHIVICTGMLTPSVAQSINWKISVTPLWGWSLSAPLREATYAPHATIVDPSKGLTIGRIGNRMRVSGGFSLGPASEATESRTVKGLFEALQQYFPGSAQLSSGTQTWKASVGSLPDGLPAIGACGLDGVWMNAAHGPNGWGMAYGSAELISAMISRRSPPMDASSFTPNRF